MRSEYDFAEGRRNPYATRIAKRRRVTIEAPPDDYQPLTQSQIRKLRASVADAKDRTRHLLVSRLANHFWLYYDVSSDSYVMNEPAHATLFKRRKTALAVRKLLGRTIEVLSCRVDSHGKLILRSVPSVGHWRHRPRGAA